MRALRLPRLLVLSFALLLVGGQQAALAHMLGHAMGEVGKASQATVQQGDDDHGAALTLSHVCTTCLALDFFVAPPRPRCASPSPQARPPSRQRLLLRRLAFRRRVATPRAHPPPRSEASLQVPRTVACRAPSFPALEQT